MVPEHLSLPGISQPILISLKRKIEEAKEKNGVDLQFGLQVDEIHLKKCIETDGSKSYGYVDLGTGSLDYSESAKVAQVFMLVGYNNHLKTRVAHYFIHNLKSEYSKKHYRTYRRLKRKYS